MSRADRVARERTREHFDGARVAYAGTNLTNAYIPGVYEFYKIICTAFRTSCTASCRCFCFFLPMGSVGPARAARRSAVGTGAAPPSRSSRTQRPCLAPDAALRGAARKG